MRFIGTNAADYFTDTEAVHHLVISKSGADVVNTGPADDLILSGPDGDTIRTGAGYDRVFAGAGNDFVANDEVEASGDRYFGGADNDSLWGATGNDHLFGGSGDDDMIGGAGNDIMQGGEGVDHFHFLGSNEGTDVVLDFEHGVDKLNLDPADVTIVDLGSAIRLDYEFGHVILLGVTEIDTSDFYF